MTMLPKISTRLTLTPVIVSGVVLLLSGCAGTAMFHHDAPNEMAVQREAPLVVPPDFSLSPPKPGEPRPNDSGASTQVQEALFGSAAPRSAIENQALARAGSADNGIRSGVGDPKTNTVSKAETTRDIIAAPPGDGQTASTAIPPAGSTPMTDDSEQTGKHKKQKHKKLKKHKKKDKQ